MTAPLVMEQVERRYGARRVLASATLRVEAGEVAGLIGPNGAGKTTLLRIAAGLVAAHGGRVTVAREGIGYFAGESTIPGTLAEQRWRGLFGDVDAAAANRPIRLLSRGTRQLLGLRTVLGIPRIRLLLLDEPWEGLDPDASRWLAAAVRARRDAGTAVLVSSHRLHDLAGVCDHYTFLDGGCTTTIRAPDLAPNGVTGEALLAAFDRIRGGPR